jgi:hypothetical protein
MTDTNFYQNKLLELERRIWELEQGQSIMQIKTELDKKQKEIQVLKENIVEFLSFFDLVFRWDFSFTLNLIEDYESYVLHSGRKTYTGDLSALFDLVDPENPCNNMGNLGCLYCKYKEIAELLESDLLDYEKRMRSHL